MARLELSNGPERPVSKLALGLGSLLLAVGYAQLEYPPLFFAGHTAIGGLSLLEYASPRFRKRMDELRSSISNLVAITISAAFGAVLFRYYGYPRWASALALGAVVFALVFVFYRTGRR